MTMLETLEHDWKTLRELPLPEADADRVDLAGRLNALANSMQSHKRLLLAEVGSAVRGTQYQTAVGRKAERSYSTAAILSDFAAAGVTIQGLLALNAVEMKWRWTELKRAMADAGITLRLAPREIDNDGDVEGPHVGEHWVEDVRLEGVKFD